MVPGGLGLSRVDQVCFVVRDLEAAMERYWRTLGIGPWKVRTSGAPPLRATYRGRPCSYRARIAMAQAGPVILELVQHLEGESIYRDILAERGESFHHLGVYVPNLEEALAYFRNAGIGVLQSATGTGVKGDGGYAYLDTESQLGTILEVIKAPSDRVPPERTYP